MFMSQLKGEKSWPVFNCCKFAFKEIVLRHQRGGETLKFGIKEVGEGQSSAVKTEIMKLTF